MSYIKYKIEISDDEGMVLISSEREELKALITMLEGFIRGWDQRIEKHDREWTDITIYNMYPHGTKKEDFIKGDKTCGTI